MKDAIEQEIDSNKDIQQAEREKKMLEGLPDLKDDNSPMAKVNSDLKSGDADNLGKDLGKALSEFDKMPPDEQKKMIEQAQKMAEQLTNAANPQQAQQQIQQQLQQLGAAPSRRSRWRRPCNKRRRHRDRSSNK